MTTTTQTQSTPTAPTSFPIPFTLEQLREDILQLYLLQLRNLSLFASEKKLTELADGINLSELHNGTIQARTFGLTYEAIQDTAFAKAMEQQYSFAFHGVDNLKCESFYPDSKHTWVAAFIHDLKTSVTVEEWGQYDAEFDVSRILHTCELANARDVLETGEGFFTFMGAWGDPENSQSDSALTIHQMALLSGLEEMTIRTAISRPSTNQLKHFKDDRRTLVTVTDAKEWLIAKGRYIPVSQINESGQKLDLDKVSFSRVSDFASAVLRHVQFLNQTQQSENLLEQLSIAHPDGDLHLRRDELMNSELMAKLAVILGLPASLFVLKAKETVLNQDMAELKRALADELSKS
jgi:hypothetical protein